METKITVLIRTKVGRESLLARCKESIEAQTHKCDIIEYLDIHNSHPDSNSQFFYNLFCNQLKDSVKNGYFLFIDDDDFLHSPYVISEVVPLLVEDKANIVQMWRDDTGPKPFDWHIDSGQIVLGKIGMPCIILHSKYKWIANLDDTETADFKWITRCVEKLGGNFIKKIVVNSPHRSYGQ